METQVAFPAEGELEAIKRDMRDSQRALELRKFFAPNTFKSSSRDRDFNDSLNNDGALDAYAETVVWRLNGVHAMVSLIDRGMSDTEPESFVIETSEIKTEFIRGTQYFLAGCMRQSGGDGRVTSIEEWFGCTTVAVPGGLCENTLALDLKMEQYPCFVVKDLSQDERFARLPVVDGTLSSYRFYAGAPITTSYGVNIGSFFLFDDKSRPHGLLLHEKKFMHQQAANVMKHLETKREAWERRRGALMSQGIAKFLERDSNDPAVPVASTPPVLAYASPASSIKGPQILGELNANGVSNSDSPNLHNEPESSVLDKIRVTLDQAAGILRESLELTAGGVVFLDTALAFTDIDHTDESTDTNAEGDARDQSDVQSRLSETTGNQEPLQKDDKVISQLSNRKSRRSSERYKTSRVLAMSASESESGDLNANILATQTIQSLISAYPKGNIWYIDEEGYFSSLEQISKLKTAASVSPSGRRQSIDVSQQRSEATTLSRLFQKARQVIFLPLWDAAGSRWYSGCFVWSETAVPVFTVDSELAYLSAFTSSVMAEISRLDAITSNKMKSDFISSISHEFRSPLHGILASAEFLRESEPSGTQLEFISTIQNCGGTLLDTINHVLDYSKINSFEKSGTQQGTISNELYQMTNLALLCEDIVNGMIAANEYRGAGDASLPRSDGANPSARPMNTDQQKRLDIILDIEHRDWEFNVQPGALRRVVMNIFGNAQKYTDSGYILVQLRMLRDPNSDAQIASLRIRDSGRGMSLEYMERKLYHPFAQEDSFAPGVGLGLSIVWSIVNQLGGKIAIRSELGTGTEVEITLPVERAEDNLSHSRHSDLLKVLQDAEQCVSTIRQRTAGKSVSLACAKSPVSIQHELIWNCIHKYCTEWFGFDIKSTEASILITDSDEALDVLDGDRILLVHDRMLFSSKHKGNKRNRAVETICQPIGPFRLARSLLNLMDAAILERVSKQVTGRSDNSTQTPMGSPEERTVLNGIIANDYGFETHTGDPHGSQLNNSAEPHVSGSFIQKESATEHFALDQFNGRIGSNMTLRLPPSRNPISSTVLSSTVSTSADIPIRPKAVTRPPTSLHILAVDDNELNLQLIQRYLNKRKADTVVIARNGVEAVEAVRKRGIDERFDIIFMDISMPEMNGFEATRLIREYERSRALNSTSSLINPGVSRQGPEMVINENPSPDAGVQVVKQHRANNTYIVALTGLASRRDRDTADEIGFDDFLTKPISFGKIGKLLENLSEEKALVGMERKET